MLFCTASYFFMFREEFLILLFRLCELLMALFFLMEISYIDYGYKVRV